MISCSERSALRCNAYAQVEIDYLSTIYFTDIERGVARLRRWMHETFVGYEDVQVAMKTKIDDIVAQRNHLLKNKQRIVLNRQTRMPASKLSN